jgi:hypothetical protein
VFRQTVYQTDYFPDNDHCLIICSRDFSHLDFELALFLHTNKFLHQNKFFWFPFWIELAHFLLVFQTDGTKIQFKELSNHFNFHFIPVIKLVIIFFELL